MARIETWLCCDLKRMTTVQSLPGKVFDKNSGNQIGVIVTDGGAPAVLSGNVYGFIVLSDGSTKKVNGALSGNRAYIVIPQEVYRTPGPVSIAVKIGTTTVCAINGVIGGG